MGSRLRSRMHPPNEPTLTGCVGLIVRVRSWWHDRGFLHLKARWASSTTVVHSRRVALPCSCCHQSVQ